MRRTGFFYTIFICLLFVRSGFSQHQQLEHYLASLSDAIHVSMKAEASDGTLIFEHDSKRRVPSASTIKVAILMELMNSISKNEIGWKTKHSLLKTDKVGGSGQLQHAKDGSIFSFGQLAKRMIQSSDNTATNIIIRQLGMERVNRFLTSNGLTQTRLQREMMDFEAIKYGQQNYTSAFEMNQLFAMLLNDRLLNKKDARRALKLLKGCEDKDAIPKMLPPNVTIAHKTGTLDYLRGDTGILFAKDQTILLSVFVEGFTSFEEADTIIATLAKMVYATQNK